MTKVTSRRSSAHLEFAITPPFFDWQIVPPKFFQMVNSALSLENSGSANDFSVVPANNLGEVAANYKIFGGTSNVTLHADRLLIDFPNLIPGDVPIALSIIEKLYTRFLETFQGHQYKTIRVVSTEHAEIVEDGTIVSNYLSRYAIPAMDEVFGEENAVHRPGVRFSAVSNDTTWKSVCTVDESELLSNGLFLSGDITFLKVADGEDFQTLLEQHRRIADACSSTLGLRWEDAS